MGIVWSWVEGGIVALAFATGAGSYEFAVQFVSALQGNGFDEIAIFNAALVGAGTGFIVGAISGVVTGDPSALIVAALYTGLIPGTAHGILNALLPGGAHSYEPSFRERMEWYHMLNNMVY